MTTRISSRVAVVLAAGAVLLVLIVGWFAFISPERSKAADLQAKIDDTDTQLATTNAYVNDPANKQAVARLNRLKQIIPDDPRISQVIRQLAQASAASGVQLDVITPSAATPVEGATAVPIALSVTGHYFNVSKFMQLLGARTHVQGSNVVGNGRLYSVSGVSFANGGAAPGESANLLSAAVSLNVYTYGATAPVAPTDTTTTSTDTTTTSSP